MEYNGSYQSDKRHTENGRGENAFAAIVIIIVLILLALLLFISDSLTLQREDAGK